MSCREQVSIVPAKANTERMTSTPVSGVFLDEEAVALFEGTIDLNGNTLTVASYVGNILDNSADKSGALDVEDFVPVADNAQMPLYTETGYVFADITKQELGGSVANNVFDLTFKPSFGTANAILANGGEAAQISIVIRLAWTDANGEPQTKDLVYSDDMVKEVYGNGMAFSVKAYGVESFEDLAITTIVKSATGAEWAGTSMGVVPDPFV